MPPVIKIHRVRFHGDHSAGQVGIYAEIDMWLTPVSFHRGDKPITEDFVIQMAGPTITRVIKNELGWPKALDPDHPLADSAGFIDPEDLLLDSGGEPIGEEPEWEKETVPITKLDIREEIRRAAVMYLSQWFASQSNPDRKKRWKRRRRVRGRLRHFNVFDRDEPWAQAIKGEVGKEV